MNDSVLLWVLLILALGNLAVLLAFMFRPPSTLANGIRKSVEEDLRKGREESGAAARSLREEVTGNIASLGDGLAKSQRTLTETLSKDQATLREGLSNTLTGQAKLQQEQLTGFGRQLKELEKSNTESLEKIRATLDVRVRQLQEENEKKLEEMRKTVDEKLQGTLERRLGESFKLVSERLEAVQQGLGEMKNLATGVGDLKRVLTNVKSRGTWAEVQLGTILDEFLAPGQFERNVVTKHGSSEVVEFAVRLPGRPDVPDSQVWLPIDSKFPQEDYIRLQDAAEQGDTEGVQRATDALARTLRNEAQKIQDKYLDPPGTTDFGIMFLATEGLYAEALRHPALVSDLQHDHRIVVAGPTTLAAILNSLRMGFQTLAIEKRASEVWKVLAAVKTEFGRFGEVLARVKKQIGTVNNTIGMAERRTRVMEQKLRSVEMLPEQEAGEILALEAGPSPPQGWNGDTDEVVGEGEDQEGVEEDLLQKEEI
jgi:DNA recombination protein RmuC